MKRLLIKGVAACLLSLLLPLHVLSEMPGTTETSGSVVLWFMNTGKSDCILISCGEHAALIDTGLASSAATMLGVLREAGIAHLDCAFLTHTDKDHIGGLQTLLQYVPTDTVYRSIFSDVNKKGENKIDSAAAEAGKETSLLSVGNMIFLTENVFFKVLSPIMLDAEDDNNNSLVLMLEAYGKHVLLTGDMLYNEEKILLKSGKDISADILKVAHHGRPDATSEAFLNAVAPDYAVILTDRAVKSDSANPLILNMLEKRGIEYSVSDMTEWGVRYTIERNGDIRTEFPEKPVKEELNLAGGLDRDGQCLLLRNAGKNSIDLSGYVLYSEKKDSVYVFPEDVVLEPSASVTVTGTKGEGMLIWPDVKKPFPKEDKEAVLLFDRGGNLIASFD